jgi:hypothetical protein
MPSLEASKTIYNSHLRHDFGDPLGCSLATIMELERRLDCQFPAA